MTVSDSWLRDRRPRLIGLIAAVMAPMLGFYAFLFALSNNLPVMDDYDAALNFANHLVALPAGGQKWRFFLSSLHNEYKLFFAHAVVWLQLAITGHLNFNVLSAVGNLSILVLGIFLWKMFLPETNLERRLALFMPVSLLLFQFQYWETLDWPIPSLANLPVVACAVGSLYLLRCATRPAFWGALALMALGICAYVNGFFIVLLGIVILALSRRFWELAAWIGTGALLAWAYSFHYQRIGSSSAQQPLWKMALHPHPFFVLGFLGAAGRYPVRPGAVVLGFTLCVFFAWMIRRGYMRKQPVVAYCLAFVVMTAIVVSVGRSQEGLAQSMASRYRIYSDLLLVFAWFALAEEFLLDETRPLRGNRLFAYALTASLVFSAGMDTMGVYLMHRRNKVSIEGMRDFEQSGMVRSPVIIQEDPQNRMAGFPEHARQILIESEHNGTYIPKPY